MELWKNVKDLVSPGNLSRLGNISYTTLAVHLDLLEELNQREIILMDNETKVKNANTQKESKTLVSPLFNLMTKTDQWTNEPTNGWMDGWTDSNRIACPQLKKTYLRTFPAIEGLCSLRKPCRQNAR